MQLQADLFLLAPSFFSFFPSKLFQGQPCQLSEFSSLIPLSYDHRQLDSIRSFALFFSAKRSFGISVPGLHPRDGAAQFADAIPDVGTLF